MERLRTTRDLLAEGFSHTELRRQISLGERTRVRRGVYADGDSHADGDGDAAGARAHRQLARSTLPLCAPGTVLSHGSAALTWGLPVDVIPGRVEVTRPPRAGGQDRGNVHLHVARLDPSEITIVEGMPVTTLARTVVDLARALPLAQSVIPGDAALAAGLARPELDHVLALSAHRPGVVRARRACAFFDGRSESGGESVSRVRMAADGLPAPELQYEVRDRQGRLIARGDFFWSEQRTLGEFDGRVKYGRLLRPGQEPGDVVWAEKRREDAIRRLGLEVVRWGWADLFAPGRVAGWVRDAFQNAALHSR